MLEVLWLSQRVRFILCEEDDEDKEGFCGGEGRDSLEVQEDEEEEDEDDDEEEAAKTVKGAWVGGMPCKVLFLSGKFLGSCLVCPLVLGAALFSLRRTLDTGGVLLLLVA